MKDTGLVARHVYTVVGVAEENGKRYVVVRNPWGHGEWKGEGSDGNPDGIFKIPIEDYKKLFSCTDITKKAV